MRTSLNNIKIIEDYLLGGLGPGESLLFEANILLNNDLREEVEHQRNTYAIVRQYGRQTIRAEIRAVQQILVTAPQHKGFMQRIKNIFSK